MGNFEGDYTPGTKTLGCTTARGARDSIADLVTWGDADSFKLICKASSIKEGWMKSTKAMEVGFGVVIQVTTQQKNAGGTYSIAEALTTVDNAQIHEGKDDSGKVVKRWIGAR